MANWQLLLSEQGRLRCFFSCFKNGILILGASSLPIKTTDEFSFHSPHISTETRRKGSLGFAASSSADLCMRFGLRKTWSMDGCFFGDPMVGQFFGWFPYPSNFLGLRKVSFKNRVLEVRAPKKTKPTTEDPFCHRTDNASLTHLSTTHKSNYKENDITLWNGLWGGKKGWPFCFQSF